MGKSKQWPRTVSAGRGGAPRALASFVQSGYSDLGLTFDQRSGDKDVAIRITHHDATRQSRRSELDRARHVGRQQEGGLEEALKEGGFSEFARDSAILTTGGRRHPLAQAQSATWDLVRHLSDQRAAR